MKTFKEYLKEEKNIRLGATYSKYLTKSNNNFEKIKAQHGYVKSYLITNKPNQQIFRGILNILKDGRAIMNVNYTSYRGVKNKYKVYYNKKGKEIISNDNNEKKEKKYFDMME